MALKHATRIPVTQLSYGPMGHTALVHFALADGRAFSVSATLANVGNDALLLQSSIVDVRGGRYATRVIGDERIPAELGNRLAQDPGTRHSLVRRALDETFSTGQLPYPDAIALRSDIASTMTVDRGEIALRLAFADVSIRCDVRLMLRGEPAGAVGLPSWIPRCGIEGTLVAERCHYAIAGGIATSFGILGLDEDRILIHLDDATDIHVWSIQGSLHAVIARADGQREEYGDVRLTPTATWTSRYTFHDFAEAWHVHIPRAEVELDLRAALADQELVTVTTREPRWQGRCEVDGTVCGRRSSGVAYVVQSPLKPKETLHEFFATIPREVVRALHRELPLPLSHDSVVALMGDGFARYMSDIDLEEFQRSLIAPIREILDRKGKAWRSYVAVLCFHALRGDKRRTDVIQWLLALAEVVHVGSLIVDDVEDASPTRRGGPSCHIAHGVPLAINAGSFCYFVWQSWLARLDVPSADKLRIYELYFEFMRVGHLGQALDLQGVSPTQAEEIGAFGDVSRLMRQLKSIYVLKTGAPASVFAQIGAILAGGGKPQVRAIAELFEAIGIAFQIMDDVQNLKGFVGDSKHCEDLIQAKITMPLLEAMQVLDSSARRDLWQRVVSCAQQPELVPSIIAVLERCDAFGACRRQAQRLLDEAWHAADPLLEASIAKIMIRAFCLYVVDCLG